MGDKRLLLFVLLVSASFFGLNMYFSHERDKRNRSCLKEQQLLEEKRGAAARSRKVESSALPLVEMKDESGVVVARGIDVHGKTLTLAWAEPLPESVYVKGKKESLVTHDSVKTGPVLYAGANWETLELAYLPPVGTFDIQLVVFTGDQAEVFLGEMREGTLSFPLGAPSGNALALFKTQEGYLPVGFYERRSNSLIALQELPLLSELSLTTVGKEPSVPVQEERFYLLESPTQQLVFSNIGGALVEINLPFASADGCSESSVLPIGFDKELAKEKSSAALFPLHNVYLPNKKLSEAKRIGGYYPLLRRDLPHHQISAAAYAFNLVSEYPETAQLLFTLKEHTSEKIVFEAKQVHRRITKSYRILPEAPYVIELTINVEGDSRGLWLTSGVPEVEIISNAAAPLIQYRLIRKGKSEIEKLDLPKVKEAIIVTTLSPDWVANSNGYFGIILDPKSEIAPGYRAVALAGDEVPTRLSLIDPPYQPYKPARYPGYEVFLPLPAKNSSSTFRIFAGPLEEKTLKAVDAAFTDRTTGESPDYASCRTFYGWFSFISAPFANFLFIVMKFFHTTTGSWALSIILLTVFLRILLYPLNAWSLRSMTRMRAIAPEVQAIQKRHKKDPKKAQAEVMALYREKKVNPFTGCLPIVIQLPFLIAMFDLLKSTFPLRGASFIPGWIDNLTAPDVLFEWKQPIFFVGNQFHLLPLILGIVMFWQQRLSSPTKGKTELTDQERQQKAMGTIMAVVFTVMFYNFPSGLNIYWLSSMLLAILQQWITQKMMTSKERSSKLKVKT